MRVLAALLAILAASMPAQAMLFGMDAGSTEAQAAAGAAPDVATLWVGPWNLEHGWLGPAAQLEALREQRIMPVIHLYYWGDDLSRPCLEEGCRSELHDAWKDQAGWAAATEGLLALLEDLQGAPVAVLLETEFNKVGGETAALMAPMLAAKAVRIKEGYPAATVVLPFGNWGRDAWVAWDEAAAASDAIGVQAMRAGTRHDPATYRDAYEETLAGARHAARLFGKPVWIHDVALSSFGEEEGSQAAELSEFFEGRHALEAAGVEALVYRSWRDTNMSAANYFGEAERHWGLVRGGEEKPAARIWTSGVAAARSEEAPRAEDLLPDPDAASTGEGRPLGENLRAAYRGLLARLPFSVAG